MLPSPRRLDCSLEDIIKDERRRPPAPREVHKQQQKVKCPPPRVVAVPQGYVMATVAPPPVKRLAPGDAALLSTQIDKQENGDVVITFKQTQIIAIKGDTGDMVLSTGGYKTFSTRSVMNQALQPIGLKVEESTSSSEEEEDSSAGWVVSDGRSFLQAFEDGMVIKQVGSCITRQQLIARGSVVYQYLKQKKSNAEHIARMKRHHHRTP